MTIADGNRAPMIIADDCNMEALACCRIVCNLLRAQLARQGLAVHYLPVAFMDIHSQDGLPQGTAKMMVLCTNGAFQQHRFLKFLILAWHVALPCLPVVTDQAFRFPTKSFYRDLSVAVQQSLLRHLVASKADSFVDFIGGMFKHIAVTIDSLGSTALLQSQVAALVQRLNALPASLNPPSCIDEPCCSANQRPSSLPAGIVPVNLLQTEHELQNERQHEDDPDMTAGPFQFCHEIPSSSSSEGDRDPCWL